LAKKDIKMISNSTIRKTKTLYFSTKYTFFCVFYCCFTALLFSQKTTNSVYIATNTNVFGIENSYIKKIEKKQITLSIKENTAYSGLNTLKNTRLVFFIRNTNSYKINTVTKTSQLQTKPNSSKTPCCFKQTDENPYSYRWWHAKLAVISLVTGQQKNNKRNFFLTISKFKTGASALETVLQNTKKKYYHNQTTVITYGCWLENTFARPPPQRS
jgi:hypothetical protein